MARKIEKINWVLNRDDGTQYRWIRDYLSRKVLHHAPVFLENHTEITSFISQLDNEKVLKMKAAWRTYKFRKNKAKKEKQFSFSMCCSLEHIVENLAASRNISKSAFVENAIRHYQNCSNEFNDDEKELLWEDSIDGLLSQISSQKKEIKKLERTVRGLEKFIKNYLDVHI